MAELAIAVTAKLIELIASEGIKEICEFWGYKSQLKKLNKTVTTIKAVLHDAEAKRNLTNVQQRYIADLKDVVYDADDLFDEFLTLVNLKEFDADYRSVKWFEKVRKFFSSKKKKSSQALRMSGRVREIKEQLDAIANDYSKFGFSVNDNPIAHDYAKFGFSVYDNPIVRRREETCSYVDVKDIIGRDKDKEAILDMLLAPNAGEEGFCFLTLVGVGGLGKTSLAQFVYNDKKIEEEFPFRFWVCVSDQDGEQFDVKTILCKIIESITKQRYDGTSTMELVQNQFREKLGGKKYFLVLDDVWNEDLDNWIKLKKFLMLGRKGSRIVVTTRSENTASSLGSEYVYRLKGLSREDSWGLFEMSAYVKGEMNKELVEIGKKINRKCGGIPLAIKVLGRLLYNQDISKWRSFENSGLNEIGEGSDKILTILKLSYHNLAPPLKSCFCYCAIFPKDFEMDKDMLICLWMAQGYIKPLVGGQSLESTAEEYFMILVQRCFFQDVKKDDYGNVKSVKMHDFMHDVAQEVGKEEICVITTNRESNLGEQVRHVNVNGAKIANISLHKSKIRSYIASNSENHWWYEKLDSLTDDKLWDKQVENLTALRVLDLSFSDVNNNSFLLSMNRFLLLRYLKLSVYFMGTLPDSITGLYNLETLVLECPCLRNLPTDFSKLSKLRLFNVSKCLCLTSMPLDMHKLTNLRVLPYFVAGNYYSEDELKVLQALNKIQGSMHINIKSTYRNVNMMMNDGGGGYLKSMKYLEELIITYEFLSGDEVDYKGGCVNPEDVLERLQPPSGLKGLYLSNYEGTTIPWMKNTLPHNLVCLKINNCSYLEQFPVLSKLPNLKSLKLIRLNNIEYMENNGMMNTNDDTKAATKFFPSLEYLEIVSMKKLKSWWKEDCLGLNLRINRLRHLNIAFCPKFTSFTSCSSLEYQPELQLPNLCTLEIFGCHNLDINLVCTPPLEMLELDDTSERFRINGEFGKSR